MRRERMRLVTYRDRDRNIKAGALIDEEIVDISDQVATRHVAFRLLWWNCWLRSKTYVPVARIVARPQNTSSPERRVYVDEKLSFDPWHCLAAHRPLGNVMRARFHAYKASTEFRHSANGQEMVEPRS